MAALFPLEVQLTLPGGRPRRLRFGPLRSTLAGVLILAALGGLVGSILTLPSLLATERVEHEMAVALSRRAQLGDRLHALVDRSEQLQRQVDAHAFRVGQIRRLYGLPEIALATLAEPSGHPAGETIYAGALLYAARRLTTIESRLVAADALLAALGRWEAEHADEVATVPALFPLSTGDVVPTAGFGAQRNPVSGEPEFHAGVDFAAPEGSIIRAPAAGVVRWAGEPPQNAGDVWWQLGKVVVIAHGTRYRTIFGHCDRILARVGARVAPGDAIATVGHVGWAPVPRLHYEVRRWNGDDGWVAVDPTTLLLATPWVEEGSISPPAARRVAGLAPPPLPTPFAR